MRLFAPRRLLGIRPECIILNASHTHYGPGTVSHAMPGLGGLDIEFTRRVCAAITNALPKLYQDLFAELSWSRCEVQVGFNRRQNVTGILKCNPIRWSLQRETPLLLVQRQDGERCLMVNHGCHPTGLGPQAVISSDYPGVMRQALTDRGVADVVMFLQGAAKFKTRRTGR